MENTNYPSDLLREALSEAQKIIEAYEEVMTEQVKAIERLEREKAALWDALALQLGEKLH